MIIRSACGQNYRIFRPYLLELLLKKPPELVELGSEAQKMKGLLPGKVQNSK